MTDILGWDLYKMLACENDKIPPILLLIEKLYQYVESVVSLK